MVLKGQINNVSAPHVHTGSDITTGEVDQDNLPRIDELREATDNTNLDVTGDAHGLCPKAGIGAIGAPVFLGRTTGAVGWGAIEINSLSDVQISPYAQEGDFLRHDGTSWYRCGLTDSNYPSKHSMARQAIINGNFDVWQRGTSFTSVTTPANSDDTYLPDRWILLSDGNDVVDVSREATIIPEGSAFSLKCEVETANKKFGWVQILESVDSLKLAGKKVSLSFQARTTTGKAIENLRAAVISWTGTADTVTSDVVSAWGNEGVDPTLAANWTYENTPSNLVLVPDTFTEYKIEGIDLDTSGLKNIAVFVWVDDTDAAVDDLLYLSQVQVCAGDIALPFEPKTYAEELKACQRYFWRLNPNNSTYAAVAFGQASAATTGAGYLRLDPEMRAIPTITLVGSKVLVSDSSGFTYITGVNIGATSTKSSLMFTFSGSTGTLTAGRAILIYVNNDSASDITFSAEL